MKSEIKVELLSSWVGAGDGDASIAHAAWASSTDFVNLANKTDDDIRRITSNVVNLHHDTPKERVWMEFFVTCPLFLERQWDKYRMTVQYQDFQVEFLSRPMGGNNITQNELSGRYRTIPERYLATPQDVQGIFQQAHSDATYTHGWTSEINDAIEGQYALYDSKLRVLKASEKAGHITNAQYKRAREYLRGILGTAYMTDMRICMNLNAFEHIMNQRLPKDAQIEAQEMARLMLNEVVKANVAPNTIDTMIKVNGW